MPGKKKKQKCYIYTRVSTAMQVDGFSLDAQRERLLQAAKYHDLSVVREFSDAGFSGKNTTGRPQFTEMMRLIRNGNPDGVGYVLVFKLSRFARNAADVLLNLEIMESADVALISADEGIDSSGSAGRLVISVLAAVAEIERSNIRDQSRAGRQQKAREGSWNGGPAPLGYKIVRDENGRNGHLAIEESEAELVRLIFDRYVRGGMGFAGVAKWLNENGYRRTVRRGGKHSLFAEHAVKQVLQNPVYTGRIAYGRYGQEKIQGTRDEYRVVRRKSYDTYDGKHEAIIDDELWEKAQAKMKAAGAKQLLHYGPKHIHLLSGIVRCPVCGSSMYGRVVRRKKHDGSGEYYPDIYYYSCRKTRDLTGEPCTYTTNIREDDLDEEVIAIAQTALDSMPFSEDVIKGFGRPEDLDTLSEERDGFLAERKQQERKKSRLREKIRRLDPGSDLYDAMYADLEDVLQEINGEIADLDDRIADVEERIRTAEDGAISAEKMMRVFERVAYHLDEWPDDEQRDLMHLFFDRIEILSKPRPGGQRVTHVRFKFPISLEGGPVDLDHDVYYDDDDDPPDGDPPSGGGPKPDSSGSPGGGDESPLEIDLSDGGDTHAGNCVPKPTGGKTFVGCNKTYWT